MTLLYTKKKPSLFSASTSFVNKYVFALEDIFATINTYQPIRHKDPEYFKSVVTRVVPVDENDEGFSSIHLNVKMAEIYKYFRKLINDYEIRAVQKLRT